MANKLVVRLNKGVQVDLNLANTLIVDWVMNKNRYSSLQNYYVGDHSIKTRTFADTTKPNNKVINNFASYIVDVRSGYFTGVPLTYTSEDEKYLEELRDIFDTNNETDVTAELDKISNIKGHAYELLWVDEDSNIRFKEVNPEEIIMVYSADITEKPMYAIRYYDEVSPLDKVVKRYIDIYSAVDIQHYVIDKVNTKEATPLSLGTDPHYFGEVPVIEYVNNSERMGSFEDEVALIDAYNIAQSDSVNDIQYFNDAYLKLKNMSGTESADIQAMKENRVLLVEGDGDADWLTKNVNDTYLENIKDRISKDIHKFSKTPNLVSEEFIANLSGTAIRYKVWGLEQDTAKKERKWKKALMTRIRLITNILNLKGNKYDWKSLKITFNRNLPQNVMELGQMVSQLRGTVSVETLLGQLPFVEDVKQEMDRLEEERTKNPFGDYNIAPPSNQDNKDKMPMDKKDMMANNSPSKE